MNITPFLKLNLIFRWGACASLLMLLILAGCAKNEGVKVKISSWGDLQENAILNDLITQFQTLHPDIKVELQRIPYTEYTTKLITQMAGGQAPDVICAEVGNYSDFYLRDALEPLNEYVEADKVDMSAYYPKVVDRFTVDGKLYVIARDTAPICVIYYNKDIFNAVGVVYPKDSWTWEEFVAAAEKVKATDSTGRVTRWGFVDDWVMSEAWIYDFGGSYVDDIKHPTRWTFADDPHTLEGVKFRSDLINKYKVMLPPSSVSAMGGLGNADMFVNGNAAMFLSGIWKTPEFRHIKNFKWDVVMLPKGPNGHRAFSTGGSGYGILKSSKYKKEAWELVKFISGEEGAKKLASTGFAQPALMKVANSSYFLDGQDPKNKKMLLEAVKYVEYGPLCKNWTETLSGIIGPEMEKVWNATETAEQAMANLKPRLDANPPQTK